VKIPHTKPLSVEVPKKSNFRIPEGKYRAKIMSVRKVPVEKLNGTVRNVKLLFEVQVPSQTKTLNLANAEYREDMNPGSDLHNVLTRLFGAKALDEAAGSSFDLEPLENMDVDIEIEHVITSRREEYDYPLVKVHNIQPKGTLVKDGVKPEPVKEGKD
jgi:hypothetical protein